jgi:hypothetical protein
VGTGFLMFSGLLGEGDGPMLNGLGVEIAGLSGDPNLPSCLVCLAGGVAVIK